MMQDSKNTSTYSFLCRVFFIDVFYMNDCMQDSTYECINSFLYCVHSFKTFVGVFYTNDCTYAGIHRVLVRKWLANAFRPWKNLDIGFFWSVANWWMSSLSIRAANKVVIRATEWVREKIAPAQPYFRLNWCKMFTVENSSRKFWILFVILKVTAQSNQLRSMLKFAQSVRPGCNHYHKRKKTFYRMKKDTLLLKEHTKYSHMWEGYKCIEN
jgi:hypothetical protein